MYIHCMHMSYVTYVKINSCDTHFLFSISTLGQILVLLLLLELVGV